MADLSTSSNGGQKGAKPVGIALAIILVTIALEGGYVRNRADPGGETNFGITKVTARANGYYGPMRTLPKETAQSIYYKQYLVKPGYEPLIAIDAPVTEELFDTTVNMGAARPSRWFEQSINTLCDARIAEDGQVGPGTISAYASCQTRVGATKLCIATLEQLDGKQRAEYLRIVTVHPERRPFLKGWLANRIGNVDRRDCARGRKAA